MIVGLELGKKFIAVTGWRKRVMIGLFCKHTKGLGFDSKECTNKNWMKIEWITSTSWNYEDIGVIFKICADIPILICLHLQGPQGLSAHFEMALTRRKKVAMSKVMVASNSQQRNNF